MKPRNQILMLSRPPKKPKHELSLQLNIDILHTTQDDAALKNEIHASPKLIKAAKLKKELNIGKGNSSKFPEGQ